MSRDPDTVAPQISQAAAEWFVIMREPVVCESDRAMFSTWLQASPVHVRAYLDIVRLWGDAAQLGPELAVEMEQWIPAEANVLPLRETETLRQRRHAVKANAAHDTGTARRPRGFRRRVYVAASVVALACLVSATALWQARQPSAYATDVGEQRVLTLEDGSIIRLNSRSEVSVRMLPEQRLIELIDGQALFEVAKDPLRPFIVRSGEVSARAVGTQFDVYRKPTGTVVTVVEGLVEVRMEPLRRGMGVGVSEPPPPPVPVKAGEQVTISRAGAIEQRHDANVNAATRWLQQELVFEGQPLSAVVQEFNRYQRVPIVLADPALGDLRINAVFNTTGPEPLLRFVDRMEGVQVERTRREIRITRQ